jgi:hypothetical protein
MVLMSLMKTVYEPLGINHRTKETRLFDRAQMLIRWFGLPFLQTT